MYAAVIEWPSDAIEPPDLITAKTLAGLFWPLIESLRGLSDDGYSDDRDFIKNNPYPDSESDTAALAKWLWAMRQATTAPWVEFYEISEGARADKLSIVSVLGEWTDVSFG